MSEERGLSGDDRKFLRGGKKYAHETTEQNVWQRIRKRTRRSLSDGTFYWQHIPTEQRRQIFDVGPDEDLLFADLEEYDYADVLERDRKERDLEMFEHSLTGLLAFLYAGIDEHPDLDFNSIMAQAIASVLNERGKIPQPETYTPPSMEAIEEYDTDKLRRKLYAGGSLSWMEELHLRRELTGDLEDLRGRYEDAEDVTLEGFFQDDEWFEDVDDSGGKSDDNTDE